jgi:signal transduction histidine kinase/ActR/RegA family two-component response regulator
MKKFYYFLLFSMVIFPVSGQNFLFSQGSDDSDTTAQKEHFEQLMDSSNTHYNNGDYRKDLALNFELLKLALEIDEPYYIHKGYRNLGYDYLVLGDTLLAQESFEKSEKQALLSKNDTAKAVTYMDLANIYSITGNSANHALEYHDKSIELFEKLKDSSGLAKAHYNTILTALESDEFNRAYLHIIKAKKFIPYGDPGYEAGLESLLGQYYYLIENYEMASAYFKKAIKIAEESHFTLILEDAYYYYSENLFKQKNFEAAYTARMKYEDYLAENQQKIISSEVEAVSANFQVAEYKKDVEEAEIQYQLQAEIVKNKSRLNSILIVGFSIFLILFVALFLAYRNRKELVLKLKEKNKEYLNAKEESEKFAKAKSTFFSTISHELRTPLYGVIGLTTILLEDKTLKNHLKDLKSLKFSADYLLALINDVLQINKIDSNTIENEQTTFSLRDLIKKIASSFEYMRIQNSNEIHIHISDSVPEFIYGNSVRLSQVLMNLIGNACKFTEDGNIYIIAETTKNTADKTGIKFYIRDTGIGIPLEKQERIFEEFSQLDNHNYKYQGTGLGLPIVKKLLQLDNADITLKSEAGKGSMFSFTLEYDVVNVKQKESVPILPDTSLLKGKRILVVEDNRINQIVTKKIVEKNNMSCVIAENGQIAVDIAKKESFDLILMDINMPVKNGITATKEIRLFNTITPILALTAVEVEEMRYSILESGMNDIIVKPYDVTKFIQTIYKNLTEVPQYHKGTFNLKAI